MTARPLRNDGLTMSCPICQQPFRPLGRRRYCSDRCRQAAWRSRHPGPVPEVPRRTPRVATIYECGTCEARYLGEQWCPACQRPCRRVGPGGACPHCDGPVALADLVPALTDRNS